jgi:hypothetical protein
VRRDAALFSDESGQPLPYERTVRVRLLRDAGITGLRWPGVRPDYAACLEERGVPLSQVRDLPGRPSITTTERYDNQKPEALQAAAKLRETGEAFRILSSSDERPPGDGIVAIENEDAT